MLSWLVIIPTQFASIRNKRWAAEAAAGSVVLLGVSIAAYFLVMTRPFLYPVDRSFWRKHPLAALEYLCALVGATPAHGNLISPDTLAPLLGFALIAVFAACVVWLTLAKRLPYSASWISIGLFGLGFAAMNMFGRSAWGVRVAASQCDTWVPACCWRSLLLNSADRRWRGGARFSSQSSALSAHLPSPDRSRRFPPRAP
jgi:hypothetical protein